VPPSDDVPRPAPPSWRDRLDLIAGGSSSPPLTPVQLGLAAVALCALLGTGWFLLREPAGPPAEAAMPLAGPASTSTTAPSEVVVHAAGAVVSPGLYRLADGARVADVLEAAGGAAPDADLGRVNLAAPVADGSQVYVVRVGEAPPAGVSAAGGGGDAPAGPLDLNTATLAQLEELPGVGPSTAQAIIDEREQRGRFGSVEELLDVRGIGPAKLDAIRDLVTV
jgi:competence protein ComEA